MKQAILDQDISVTPNFNPADRGSDCRKLYASAPAGQMVSPADERLPGPCSRSR